MPIDPDITRREYVARVNQVVDLIQERLDQNLSLEVLADEAGFSRFHFHRIFAGVVGEPLHAFVRRARLERAALELARRPDRSITDIALDYGFSSSANFSRAFRESFGASAREFRQARAHHPEQARAVLARIEAGRRARDAQVRRQLAAAVAAGDRTIPEVTIEDFPGAAVAYLRHYGPYEERHKAVLFRRMRDWAGKALAGQPTRFLGICYGDRGLLDPDRRRYDACVVLPEGVAVHAPVARLLIPAGRVAVHRVETGSLLVCDAWTALHRDWLPGSGFVPDDRPCVEHFPDGCPEPGRRFRIEICQAIRPARPGR